MSYTTVFRPLSQTVLSKDWGTLTKHTFQLKRRDGTWQDQTREAYDRGNGATCLLYNEKDGTVLLTRQFRLPVHVNRKSDQQDGFLIETPAGLLDGMEPKERMREELEEETGFRVSDLSLAFDAYMSPGSVTERIACYTGTYSDANRVGDGGGKVEEGEDIEVMHVPLDDALDMIASGTIADGKTIMLLQHLALSRTTGAR